MKKTVLAIVLAFGVGYLFGLARENYEWSKALSDHAFDQKNARDFAQFERVTRRGA